MKLVINPHPQPPESEIELSLEPCEYGGSGVDLRAKFISGDQYKYFLLRFNPDGSVVKYKGLSTKLGFKLTGEGGVLDIGDV